MSKEAMKLALEALEEPHAHIAKQLRLMAIHAIKEGLQAIAEAEKQEQGEPVAWRFQSAVGGWAYGIEPPIGSKYAVEPLYTTPQQRTWVGLTDEEIQECLRRRTMADCPTCEYHKQRAQIWRDEAYKLSGHPLPERDPVLEEREACAMIVDEWFHSLASEPEMEKIAEQIRARGDKA